MSDDTNQLTRRSIKAGSYLTAYRAFAKVSGLLKISILARILTPAQFGVFGFVSITLNLFENFSETGIEHALIQKPNLTNNHVTSGWLVTNIRSLILTLILIIAAPLVAKFFNSPEIIWYIWVISITPILRSLRNPQLILLKKKLSFGQESIMLFSGTVVEIFTAIGLGIMFQNIWSLVVAIVAGAVAELVMSYLVLPKPIFAKPDWSVVGELLNFGKWVWSSSALSYLVNQGDDIIVGRVLGTTALGLYQNAFKLASLPATEITATISQVSFPALAAIKADKHRLRRGFFKTVGVNLIFGLPMALVLFVFPGQIVMIIYGQDWLQMVPVLRVLAVFGLFRAVLTNFESLFVALGKPYLITLSSIVRTLVLFVLIFPLIFSLGLVGAAWATVAAIGMAFGFTLLLGFKLIKY